MKPIPELAPVFARRIKAARPSLAVILAGHPGEREAGYRAAGFDEFIHIRSTSAQPFPSCNALPGSYMKAIRILARSVGEPATPPTLAAAVAASEGVDDQRADRSSAGVHGGGLARLSRRSIRCPVPAVPARAVPDHVCGAPVDRAPVMPASRPQPKATAFYRRNLAAGQMGLSVAFDLPTHRGYDSDHRASWAMSARPAVGDDSMPRYEAAVRRIPLREVSVS